MALVEWALLHEVLRLFTKAYSFKHPCFLFLTVLLDFSKMYYMPPCLLKKEFIERKLTFSRWLGALIDSINYHLVLWFSDVFRAAYGYVQLFTSQLHALDCCAFLCSCVCFIQFFISPLCLSCHLKFLVLSVNGNVTSHSHLIPPIPFLLLIYCE